MKLSKLVISMVMATAMILAVDAAPVVACTKAMPCNAPQKVYRGRGGGGFNFAGTAEGLAVLQNYYRDQSVNAARQGNYGDAAINYRKQQAIQERRHREINHAVNEGIEVKTFWSEEGYHPTGAGSIMMFADPEVDNN